MLYYHQGNMDIHKDEDPTTDRLPSLFKRHMSLTDPTPVRNAVLERRRYSFGVIKNSHQPPVDNTSLTRKHSLNIESTRLPRDVKLPNISCTDTSGGRLAERRYTVINVPVQLHAAKKYPIKKRRSQPNLTVKPMVHSPLPRINSFDAEFHNLEDLVNKTEEGLNAADSDKDSFVPKPCHCMRCQIMFRMFRAGDKQLDVWGNYPCFRR